VFAASGAPEQNALENNILRNVLGQWSLTRSTKVGIAIWVLANNYQTLSCCEGRIELQIGIFNYSSLKSCHGWLCPIAGAGNSHNDPVPAEDVHFIKLSITNYVLPSHLDRNGPGELPLHCAETNRPLDSVLKYVASLLFLHS